VRALLIVNPHATTVTRLRRDVIVRALASELDLEVVQTRYRGHAMALASGAVDRGLGLVITLGGDGTVNEAVNGLVHASIGGPDDTAHSRRPMLAPIPGGKANVFIRALGLSTDPIDATGHILAALSDSRSRSIGLGLAGERYFTFTAGLGLDAEVVRTMEGLRANGRRASDALYLRTAIRHFYAGTDRHRPALSLERSGQAPVGQVFLGIVSNTAPWTYLGQHPVNLNPLASFDSGLDVFALRRLRTVSSLNVIRQMMSATNTPLNGRYVLTLHDEPELTVRSIRPIALQLDGEYMGEHECVVFRSVPHALEVVA
jgi:diacylglycerol kinase family enzyme